MYTPRTSVEAIPYDVYSAKKFVLYCIIFFGTSEFAILIRDRFAAAVVGVTVPLGSKKSPHGAREALACGFS
jgi:hypothetical protein